MKKLLIPLLLLVVILSGCNEKEVYEVEYVTYNGIILETVSVVEDTGIVLPNDPLREGYRFLGWYKDDDTVLITGGFLITEDTTLTAKWEDNAVVVEEPEFPYSEYLKDTNPVITITVTNVGVMTLELFPDVAKNTVDNMIAYIQDGDYTNSTFHRIIEDFMIQGGIVDVKNCSIEGEFDSNGIGNGLQHYRGVISMARTSVKDSGTSQFFIVHQDSFFLDGSYATFGALISGFSVLDSLAGQATNASDAPYDELVIESITVELNGYVPGNVVCAY